MGAQSNADKPCHAPLAQAIEWLKGYLSSQEGVTVEVAASHEPRFANTLELAVRFGKVGLRLCCSVACSNRVGWERPLPAAGGVASIGDEWNACHNRVLSYMPVRMPTALCRCWW